MKNNYSKTISQTWFQILMSAIWFLILATGGLLNVQPLWFRIMLFPILGLPAGLFYVWEIQNGESQISLGTYAAIVLLIGPISGLIVGLLLAGGIFIY